VSKTEHRRSPAGTITVKGMHTSQLEQELRIKYEKYIRNPQVGVLVTEYRQRVSVMERCKSPVVFDLTGPVRYRYDWQAGGITERAGNQVHLYRQTPREKDRPPSLSTGSPNPSDKSPIQGLPRW